MSSLYDEAYRRSIKDPASFWAEAGVEPARESEIARETVAMIRERIGPVAAFKTALVVKRLPKTRSGKILRGTIQKIADCQEYKQPATIDDPAALIEIQEVLRRAGYATLGMNG